MPRGRYELGARTKCVNMQDSNKLADLRFYPRQAQPKGAVIVMVAVMLVVLLGCAALAVDIGYLYVARAELQRTADAAALAATQALARGSDIPFGEHLYPENIYSQAESYALLNQVIRQGVVLNRNTDITIGYLANPHDRSATLQIVPLDQCNAVQVTARRTASSGGEIPLFFAPLWGINSSPLAASAVAVLDDRFYAYAPRPIGAIRGVGAIPLAVDEQLWNDQIVAGNGEDQYSFDSVTDSVSTSMDGVPEIKLFPTKTDPSTGEEGAGNFGVLHIGSGSGTSAIVEQINNGISAEDFTDLTGEPMIKFYDQISAEPITYGAVSYDILGDPGIKAGMGDALETKIGQKVGVFLYSAISGSGANTVYSITGMRFVRVMSVELHGGDKAIIIQPVPYYGPDILTSPYVPSTDRLIGTLQLVR